MISRALGVAQLLEGTTTVAETNDKGELPFRSARVISAAGFCMTVFSDPGGPISATVGGPEQFGQGQFPLAFVSNTGDDLHGRKRIAAEAFRKKIVVNPHLLHAEHIAPDFRLSYPLPVSEER